jgi:predicted phage tail protein
MCFMLFLCLKPNTILALGLVMEEEVIQAGVSMSYTGVKQMLITIRYYFILTEF